MATILTAGGKPTSKLAGALKSEDPSLAAYARLAETGIPGKVADWMNSEADRGTDGDAIANGVQNLCASLCSAFIASSVDPKDDEAAAQDFAARIYMFIRKNLPLNRSIISDGGQG